MYNGILKHCIFQFFLQFNKQKIDYIYAYNIIL